MKKNLRFLLYAIFLLGTSLLALRFDKVQPVWAGSDHQTVPTATSEASPSPSPSATATAAVDATATTGAEISPDDLTATAEFFLADTDAPTETLDLTEAASQLTRYPTVTPEDDAAAITRGRVGLIVAIVLGGLLLLAGGTVAVLYFLGASRDRDEEDQEQGAGGYNF